MSEKVVRIYRGVVLIAEDDYTLRKILEEFLVQAFKGISVVHAENGVEALQFIHRKPSSLLILNMMMPRMGGAEVLHELSKGGMRIPKLVMSGYYKTKEQVAADARVPEEFFEFMNKPFPMGDFLGKVEVLLSSRFGGKPINGEQNS